MMEVKQNTAVDLNELLVAPKTVEGEDELDNADMTDLTEEDAPEDLNCDLNNKEDKPQNGLVLSNGTGPLTPLMDIDDDADGTDLDDELPPVTTEMEDALLAEDDVLPNTISSDVTPSMTEEDLLADKVETSNSTTTSSNDRDPGDDLDTLLSKINDIVDDCLDKETSTTAVAPMVVTEKVKSVEKIKSPEKVKSVEKIKSPEKVESVEKIKSPEKVNSPEQVNVPEKVKALPEVLVEEKNELSESVENISIINIDESVVLVEDTTDDEKEKTQELLVAGEVKETVVDGEVKETVVDGEVKETVVDGQVKETVVDDKENPIIEEVEDNSDKSEEQDQVIEEALEESEVPDDKPETEELIEETQTEQETEINENVKASEVCNEEIDLPEDLKEFLTPCKKVTKEQINSKEEEKEEATIEKEQIKAKQNEEAVATVEKKDLSVNNESEKNNQKESFNKICEKDEQHAKEKSDEETKSEDVEMQDTKETEEITKAIEVPDKENDKSEEKDVKKGKEDHEDTDDEIFFYVDDKQTEEFKKPEEKIKDTSIQTAAVASVAKPKEVNEEKEEKPAADDDDVVILDDDDEVPDTTDKKVVESLNANKTKAEETDAENNAEKITSTTIKVPTEECPEKHSTNLDVDNSDNARDDFVTDKLSDAVDNSTFTTPAEPSAVSDTNATETGATQEMEETNSNCSGSSNLLLEAKTIENSVDETNQDENDNDIEADNDNEEEDDDGDVELIEIESKEAENFSEKGEELAPPAKRARLSEDNQVSSNDASNNSLKEPAKEKPDIEIETSELSASSSLKRPHDFIELDIDDKSNDSKVSGSAETVNKKPRTEEKRQVDDTTDTIKTEIKKAKEEEDQESLTEEKKEFKKMIPSYKPIPLYPPPKMDTLKTEKTFSLDFLKKFRKSFDKMTKQDLEEMVLQKVVEAIIHKSEFADMRELIEKQEKLIASHRTKLADLSKQFRDLEMVHNRVVKDIEQRNSQFIMPVKITRAVGLQVYIPNKKTIMEASSTTSGNMLPSSTQRPLSAISSQTNLGLTQRSISSATTSISTDSQARPPSALSTTGNSALANAVRRGCAQKVTPTRPMPATSSGSSTAINSLSVGNTTIYRTGVNQTQTSSSQPRLLNKSASTSTVGSAGLTASANTATSMQRNRFPSSHMDSIRLQQQQQQAARAAANAGGQRGVVPQKPVASANTVVPRRSEPTVASTSSNSTSSLDSYMNTLSQLTGGNTAVSITPAKPKEKAVIDLTDEDDLAPTPASNSTTTASATNNGPAPNQAARRSLPTPTNITNSNSQYARNAPPLARIAPSTSNNKIRPTTQQGQRPNNSSYPSSISTPAGTSITRINVSANNTQRVKYSHPAPLPATPPQAFNASWKLPPPRPTIRISNLDNGIVISWTMEESMDRHADCVSYQIYAYQETPGPPMADSWRHVGDVKAMLLPMAVTLTQFQEGQRYFFAVRAVDCHQRYGPFSLPKTWS